MDWIAGIRRNAAFELELVLAVAVGLAVCVQAYAVKPYQIPTPSMTPTLAVGDGVLVNRLVGSRSRPPLSGRSLTAAHEKLSVAGAAGQRLWPG